MGEVTISRMRAVFMYFSVIVLAVDSANEYGQDMSIARNVELVERCARAMFERQPLILGILMPREMKELAIACLQTRDAYCREFSAELHIGERSK